VSEASLLGGMSRLHDDVTTQVTAFVPSTPEEAVARDRTLQFLAGHPGGADASCQPGHVTATALVLTPDRRRTLLTLHKRIKRWIELGGHLEPEDADLAAASLREGIEESGISGLVQEPGILTIAVHEDLPCRRAPGTTHYDVYYVLTAPLGAHERISDESLDLGWFDVDALPEPLGDGVLDVLGLALSRYPARTPSDR